MGKLIVLEGIDGSGKSTQFELLCNRLEKENHEFLRVRFPRYDEPSSALIKMYLGGEFGPDPDNVNAYAASTFFAVDRFASFRQDWCGYYENGGIVLTDRYTTSNALHQGAKLPAGQREHFFQWLYDFEFNLMGLPVPDMVVYMDIKTDIAALRIKQRRVKTGEAGDIHENDISYLEQCAKSGTRAAELYKWHKIACGNERTEEEIHEEIYSLVKGRIFHE